MEHQNGVISSYTIRLTNVDTGRGNDVTTRSLTHQFLNLQSSTHYSAMVAASTSVGTGPFSEEVSFETGVTSK